MNIKSLQITRLVLFCLLIASTNIVNATAIANASATATLTITEIINTTNPGDLTDLSITGDALVSFEDTFTFGNANATTSSLAIPVGPVDLNVGGGLQQQAVVTSDASPSGFSTAEVLTDGLIDIINASFTDTFEISFSLDFSLSVLASITDFLLEDALSFANIILFDDAFDIDIDEVIGADALFGPPADSLADNIDFLLTLDPNSSNQLTLLVDADALTESVPEPSILLLFATGLFIFSWQQKKSSIPDSSN